MMSYKKLFNFIFLFTAFLVVGQKAHISKSAVAVDSLKVLLTPPPSLDSISQLWLANLYDNETVADTILSSVATIPAFDTEVFKKRLHKINEESPFLVDYNPILAHKVKQYLKHRRPYYPKMLAKARYYFPIFEEILAQYDVPLEVKYLAIIESALNPRAKSRVGAAGIWQFMYQTGKQYKLNISSYVDERFDPERSAVAAARYLKSLYKIFKDWNLALAAYNSGPGNVLKAIRRSGGYRNYWNIRPYLPRETADYVPAFFATMYIFKYAKELGIPTDKQPYINIQTDTLQVKNNITFKQIEKHVGTPLSMIKFLNPAYKLNIIPYVSSKRYAVTLPKKDILYFVKNDAAIYQKVAKEHARREKPIPKYLELNRRIRYKIRKGDYLGRIARKFGVSVRSIRKWNGMRRSSKLIAGRRLTIYPRRF